MATKRQTELQWASDVMEVYGLLGTIPSSREFSSPSAQYLFNQVNGEGGDDLKFLTTMVPKAAEMLAKHAPADLDDAFVELEKKTLGDLQKCLLDAIHDSRKVCVEKEPESPQQAILASTPSLEDLLGFDKGFEDGFWEALSEKPAVDMSDFVDPLDALLA